MMVPMEFFNVQPSIVLIGAGQLGSRHLQSLTTLCNAIIDVVDPSENALTIAQERANECGDFSANIRYLTDMSELGGHYDVAIIATNAAVRFSVTNALLSAVSIEHVIFEKVLFQQPSEYDLMARLLAEKKVDGVVNCPRRMYPLYQWVKQEYLGQTLSSTERVDKHSLVVEGHLWGLAGNSIHFIDLYAYLFNAALMSVHLSDDCEIINSKRSGYVELVGTIICTFDDGGTLTLVSGSNKAKANLYSVRLQKGSEILVIDELTGQVTNSRSEHLAPAMSPPYQSQLSASVVSSLLHSQQCALTDFTESSSLHKPLINILTHYFSRQENFHGVCPIT